MVSGWSRSAGARWALYLRWLANSPVNGVASAVLDSIGIGGERAPLTTQVLVAR
jgi:hypothetical protein